MILPTVDVRLRESRNYDRTEFPIAYYRLPLGNRENVRRRQYAQIK